MKSEWRRACKAAGIVAGRKAGGVVLYHLRHSSLTNLAAAGVPDTTARAISGHKTDSAHRRYVITQEAAKVEALAAMTALVEERRRDACTQHARMGRFATSGPRANYAASLIRRRSSVG